MIRLKQFSCGYPRAKVLNAVDLKIAPGEITVVIGQNGSGKSTLAQVLAGLKLDFQGEVWLDEVRLNCRTPLPTVRQKVGLVLQNPDHQILFNEVRAEMEFALQNLHLPAMKSSPANQRERRQLIAAKRQKLIQQTLKQVGLSDKIDTNPHELSGGQKQRLAIASVLALQPDYLILDEATSMLDLPGREAIYQVIMELKRRGMGVIMMTNSLDEILLADQVLILNQGQITTTTPTELIRQPQILHQHGLETPLLLQVARKFKVYSLEALRAKL